MVKSPLSTFFAHIMSFNFHGNVLGNQDTVKLSVLDSQATQISLHDDLIAPAVGACATDRQPELSSGHSRMPPLLWMFLYSEKLLSLKVLPSHLGVNLKGH